MFPSTCALDREDLLHGTGMRISLVRRFGAHVRALRLARDFTQETLAERAELSV
jgi:hypothetical protein